ncbi:uncharacterized protein IUM83_10999 [Phytophthora cinnamomi]|uniref:uncharacterized protein n=1 Tax=Phytophthora cinnamomi TaxID=4785 RepID=UPI0035596D0E|nr:hypothetical protein IUM83_10999 [Phytophthora cinnamomi]
MEAKLLKQSIDEKANVDVMDDGGDEGDRVEDEDEDEQPDLCVYGDNVGSGTGVERTCSSSASTESVNSVETRGFSEVGAGSAYVPTGESVGDLSELLDSAAVRDGLEAFAMMGGNAGSAKMQGTRTRDQVETQRFLELVNYSNRLGAAKVTAALKKRLSDLECSANSMGGNIFEMMLMMREENECKADARRMDEEQRRRYELAAREAHYLTEKAEAEERYRQEKLESEERARCDKEEGRARTQKLMLLIGVLT